jgi:hypothetical protein
MKIKGIYNWLIINRLRKPLLERISYAIINLSYSKRCQRLITDFGIEESFNQAAERMKEHHGIYST